MSSQYAWERPFFKNREEAGDLLADRLVEYKGKKPLILAIPRGAVPMGRIIADKLGGDLDVVLVHKVGAPDNPELALGAVGENGEFYEASFTRSLGYSEESLQKEIEQQIKKLKERRKLYAMGRSKPTVDKRVVVLVDDGIATASTMMAAIRDLRREAPIKVVVAAAVAPQEAVEALQKEADEVVVLSVQSDFGAVGEFFKDFRQVTDEEVVRILKNGAPTSKN